jgi:hypothetical protein
MPSDRQKTAAGRGERAAGEAAESLESRVPSEAAGEVAADVDRQAPMVSAARVDPEARVGSVAGEAGEVLAVRGAP